MELSSYNLTENINISYENILKMQFIPNSKKLALLKVNPFYELFIEIVDFSNKSKKQIIFNEPFLFSGSSFQENKHIKYKSIQDEYQISVNRIFEFYIFEDLDFFYLKARSRNFEKNEEIWHIKINLEGKIVSKSKDLEVKSFEECYFLKKHTINEDFLFLDIKTYDITDLSDFLDDRFEEDDFYWIRNIDKRYSIFTLPNKNLLGLVFFDKDGEIPRGKYTVLEMDNLEIPNLIFSYRIDEWGTNYVFNETGTKIAYFRSLDFGKIQIIIRELSEHKFENAIIFNVYYPKESSVPQNLILLDNNCILLIFYDRIESYNIKTAEQISLYNRDIGTPYSFHEDNIFYINSDRLIIEKLN